MEKPVLLKKDLFGEVWQRGRGDERVILRDTRHARWWTRWLARALLRREARALAVLEELDGVPALQDVGRDNLTRSFVDGEPLYIARPSDVLFFNQAARLLRRLHRRGVTHNDLAKEPNILVRADGRPAFIDFQLASWSPRRSRLFRAAAREDIRHLLKHKRTYCPNALTARERRILERPSPVSRAYMATIKPLYLFVTRRLLGWSDREGAGDRGRTT